MTEKEIKVRDFIEQAENAIHEALEKADARPLGRALKRLLSAKVMLEALEVKIQIEQETEKPQLDQKALDIIAEPIADEVPLRSDEVPVRSNEEKPKRKKKVRLDDFDTPLDVKEEAMDRDEKIKYWRAQGYTLVAIAKKVGCSPQTVLNVLNREKAKKAQQLKSEAAYADPEGGRKR